MAEQIILDPLSKDVLRETLVTHKEKFCNKDADPEGFAKRFVASRSLIVPIATLPSYETDTEMEK